MAALRILAIPLAMAAVCVLPPGRSHHFHDVPKTSAPEHSLSPIVGAALRCKTPDLNGCSAATKFNQVGSLVFMAPRMFMVASATCSATSAIAPS